MKRAGLIGSAMLLSTLAPAADLPTPESLVALAPRLALTEPGVTSFAGRVTLDIGDMALQFEIAAARPDMVAMSIVDATDHAPVLFGSNGRMLLYDPLAGEVLVAAAWPGLKMDIETPDPASTNSAKLNLFFGFQTVRSNAVTVLDLAAIAAYASTGRSVREEASGRYRLEGHTRDGGALISIVQPGRDAGPYVRMGACAPESPEKASLSVDDLRVNVAIPAATFRFPAYGLKESGLKVRELESSTFVGNMLDLGRVMKALAVRMALTLPAEAREGLAKKLMLGTVDWDAVRARDAEVARALKKIVPSPAAP